MKYTHGWSSSRGRARHLTEDGLTALCGSPLRPVAVSKRLRSLELCDHCEAARRRRKR